MDNKKAGNDKHNGLTMLEMVIALAMMAIIFAAILPQFRNIQNSWASKQAGAEAVQNARVVMDFLNRHLAKAVRITAVSKPAETNGYIEFEDNSGAIIRCDIGANNYVQYGNVAQGLFDLAGPVSKLQFTCYSLRDLDTPIMNVAFIRLVKVETTLINSAPLGQDKTFTTQAYLRTNRARATSHFGIDTVGSESDKKVEGFLIATKVTLPQDTTLAAISAYIKAPPPKRVRFAIYTNTASKPRLLIAQTEPDAGGSNQDHWHEIGIMPTELTAGTYWLAFAFEHLNIFYRYDRPGRMHAAEYPDAVANGFPDLWPGKSNFDNRKVSIYGIGYNDEIFP
jgi:prepilin-type N-terminal cleavage/methylation domain-containing protein